MRILVLGGTQFIGIHMAEVALERGHAVTLFNRGRSNPGILPGAEKLKGDRDGNLDALKGRQWDAVIDNSGYVPRHVRLSTELLAPQVSRYLFISTISARGELAAFAEIDVTRALNAGLRIRPLNMTVHDTLQWHLARPAAERAHPKAGISADREREVLAAWREAHRK
jgi:uncharacterized protein YbjT (DUF2867 family)